MNEERLGIEVACRADHRASLADERGEFDLVVVEVPHDDHRSRALVGEDPRRRLGDHHSRAQAEATNPATGRPDAVLTGSERGRAVHG